MGGEGWRRHVVIRLIVAGLVGAAAVLLFVTTSGWAYAPSVGWIAAALVYLVWTWVVVLPMDAESTREHVVPEDPPTGWVIDVVILSASVASLAGVGHLLTAGSRAGVEKNIAAGTGVVCIAVAWCVVHTVFSIRYADVYYSNSAGGIDFGGTENPRFLDFFYLGFTIGMTYQVSDTTLQTGQLRRIALGQALLSYLFGAVILAVTINLVVGLSNS
ncbi:hypothetical protein AO501_08210 [Mycobacterium gordonae]|uniref:DUF1345 domain-containing protein n=1 Tax=Mycobacterium gordonae TaxID=1778 RepID=A0A0Q2X7S7_MYCGO|nr:MULTISPECIES: DUF1345 domain-containing protein [Mycobacterium]KQH77316.1 hypothetical protein AO501_08210 [Mycobacterium gordonae]MDP7729797.1 DUF1345 domain-containing protein [Mycobacterium sp. TY813]